MRLDSEPKNGDYVAYVEALMRQYASEDALKAHNRTGFPSAPVPVNSHNAANLIPPQTEASAPTLTKLSGSAQARLSKLLFLLAVLLLVATVLTDAEHPLLPFLVFAFFVGGQILRSNAKEARAVASSPSD